MVVPPSVETIEASAFASNNDLATIIMGHNVKTIGENTYDVYNMQGIRIGDSTTGLLPGLYIIRQGAATAKIAIR